jgi:cytochrome b pre-mRNA-processing protein 3
MIAALFRSFFPANPARRRAQELYITLAEQSRNPFFYRDCAVPDTLDGRFDMLALHVSLILRGGEHSSPPDFKQLLLECLFDDMDRSLREMGVGDMGVGRRVRAMSEAVFGRIAAYESAKDARGLREALLRNVYRGQLPPTEMIEKLVEYVQKYRPII